MDGCTRCFDATRTSASWTDNVVAVQYNAWGHAYKWADGVQINGATRRTYREITAQDARGQVTGETLGVGRFAPAGRSMPAPGALARSLASPHISPMDAKITLDLCFQRVPATESIAVTMVEGAGTRWEHKDK